MLAWKPKSPDPNVASVRYRCTIPLRELQSQGFPVEFFDPSRESSYRGVIFSKCYEPSDQQLAQRLRSRGGIVILDLCDNHFYNPFALPAYERARKNLLEMIRLADIVVCSTPTLAEYVAAEAALRERPRVVGDPVEFAPVSVADAEFEHASHPEKRNLLLWFGIHGSPNAPCGMADLVGIAAPLKDAFSAASVPFELVVCSNSREKYDQLIAPLNIPSSYIEYSTKDFPGLLSRVQGVVLPVTRNPFTWCKSHNRLTTALFAGIPVVADAVPSYQEFDEFCTLSNWRAGLDEILFEPSKARRKAIAGREYILQTWMPSHVAEQWREVLSQSCSDGSAYSISTNE